MLNFLLSGLRNAGSRGAQRLLGVVLLLSVAVSPAARAATDIFDTKINIDNFVRAGNRNAFSTTSYEGATLGSGGYSPGNGGLFLNGAEVRTFKNGNSNVTGATLFYRVYRQGTVVRGSASPAFSSLTLPFGANLNACNDPNVSCDQLWAASGANINLLTGLTQRGTYVVEVFWRASTSNEGDRFDSNNGSNFVATFGFTGTPLCGTYTVNNSVPPSGDNFASFATAFISLNTAGVDCGTTFNVRDNLVYPENNVQLNSVSGTNATTRVTFQRDGSTSAGVNVRPVVRPVTNAGGNAQDAIIKLSGADFITFDGIDVSDSNTPNTSNNAQKMEYGYALFRALPTNGCQNIIVRNCAVTLNKSNSNSIGIYSTNDNISGTPQNTGATASGANSNNEFDGNTISNSYWGISLLGGPVAVLDMGNKTGSTVGNTISDIGGTIAKDVFGIKADFQSGLSIERNTVTILTSTNSAATATRGIGIGLSLPTGIKGALLVNANVVTISTGATGTVRGIDQAGTTATGGVTITNNRVQNSTLTGTGEFYGIRVADAIPTTTPITVNGNTISGNQITAASGTLFSANVNSGAVTFNDNTITNNAIPNNTGASNVYGYFQSGTPSSETLTSNTITGLSIAGTGTGATNEVRGISSNPGNASTQMFTLNTIGNLSIGGGTSGTVTGIYLLNGGGSGTSIARNKVYDLSATGASGVANGIRIDAGNTYSFSNNLLGDFRAPAASAASAVNGFNFANATATAANVYFNTVYLNASSTGATFGTSGIFTGATTPVVDLRNNIVVNLSTPTGLTGLTAALRRNGANATNTNFALTTNRNLYWAGTPSLTNVIFTDGVVTAQDLTAYKLLLAPREADSFTENPPFLSTVGTSPSFLHINPAVATQVESRGRPVAGITDDFDGNARSASLPDLGADEGAFTLTAAPLPVELTRFEAVREGPDAVLSWATASEKNNRGFEVQVSTDGSSYRELAFVAGAGSSSAPRTYAFRDREAGKAGLRYYRLRQLDFDGTASFSPVRALAFGEAPGNSLSAAPNPFDGGFTLAVQARTAQPSAVLTLFDATGRLVARRVLDVPAGSSQLPVAGLDGLAAGLYVGQLTLEGQTLHLKVLKR